MLLQLDDLDRLGADPPCGPSWYAMPTMTLIAAFAVMFLLGALAAVMGLTMWALW